MRLCLEMRGVKRDFRLGLRILSGWGFMISMVSLGEVIHWKGSQCFELGSMSMILPETHDFAFSIKQSRS
jgi:hypothetical protein